jgi:MOSC domain-containing protein YiiM
MTDWILKSVQAAMPKVHGSGENIWVTGIFKEPVTVPIKVYSLGLENDGVGDTFNHGGVDKAVSCHPWQHHQYWDAYFQWDLQPGAFGENFTIAGLTEIDVCVGDVWQVGTARFQVSQPRVPCWKQSNKLNQVGFEKLVMQTGRSGFYLRVLQEGIVTADDPITLSDRPHPQATIVRLNRALVEKRNIPLQAEFAELEPLASSWRDMFIERVHQT